jgi:Lon protease-like protein
MFHQPVPLFPLPNVVLFPQAVLPLHIFEPRYRAMTSDALAGLQQIAIALLKPGFEHDYPGKAAIEPVICIGKIVAHQELDDGRYHLLLGGLGRARIVREVAEMPYRSAVIELIPEPVDDGAVTAEERNLLKRIFDTGPLAATEMGQRFAELLAAGTPIGSVLDLVAFHLVNDAAIKQAVLNEPDPARRFALLTPVLRELGRHQKSNGGEDASLN